MNLVRNHDYVMVNVVRPQIVDEEPDPFESMSGVDSMIPPGPVRAAAMA